MTCTCCGRDNAPARRFCGGCGTELLPACLQCDFANDRDDRFCGGCGGALVAAAPVGSTPTALSDRRRAMPATKHVPAAPIHELSGLFAPEASPRQSSAIPKLGVDQDDLDRLFGAGQ